MGSLISSHLIAIDSKQPFGDMKISNYNNELLNLANDLGTRLLYAFDNQKTRLPFPRVSLFGARPESCQKMHYHFCVFKDKLEIWRAKQHVQSHVYVGRGHFTP